MELRERGVLGKVAPGDLLHGAGDQRVALQEPAKSHLKASKSSRKKARTALGIDEKGRKREGNRVGGGIGRRPHDLFALPHEAHRRARDAEDLQERGGEVPCGQEFGRGLHENAHVEAAEPHERPGST